MLTTRGRGAAIAVAFATVALSGCVYRARPRAVVVVPASARVIVVREPPVPRVEVIVVQPSPAHVWVSGYWRWWHDDYQWVAGHWERPPRHLHEWVAGHWEREPRGWFFVEGFWR
ncbi:MAG: YXWGXW repeat-containing protein [Gemmatimonadetes bacterium]|nr:YXWGXW repeat-containing protein [Gemmatimonadota bacterium]